MVADGVEDAVPVQGRDELFGKQHQQPAADEGEVEIVNLEQTVELHGLAAAHELTSAKDDDVVGNQRQGRLPERGHRRATGGEAEVLRLVALDRLKSLLEDRPQGDAKGPVQSWQANVDPFGQRHGESVAWRMYETKLGVQSWQRHAE